HGDRHPPLPGDPRGRHGHRDLLARALRPRARPLPQPGVPGRRAADLLLGALPRAERAAHHRAGLLARRHAPPAAARAGRPGRGGGPHPPRRLAHAGAAGGAARGARGGAPRGPGERQAPLHLRLPRPRPGGAGAGRARDGGAPMSVLVRNRRGGYDRPARDQRSNFELYAWFFMRISGLALIFMALYHLTWWNLIVGVEHLNADLVRERWTNPFWRLFNVGLVTFAMLHGLNGLRYSIEDYVRR